MSEKRIPVPISPEVLERILALKVALKRPTARILQGLVSLGLEAVEIDVEALEQRIRNAK